MQMHKYYYKLYQNYNQKTWRASKEGDPFAFSHKHRGVSLWKTRREARTHFFPSIFLKVSNVKLAQKRASENLFTPFVDSFIPTAVMSEKVGTVVLVRW